MATKPREKRPTREGWTLHNTAPTGPNVFSASRWHGPAGLYVISEICRAELPDGSGAGLQWHVSISQRRQRPDPAAVVEALAALDMAGAEEDNHEPGIARSFWRPMNTRHRVDCQCKANEEIITEPDGYRWTNPRAARDNPTLCRGCSYVQRYGGICTVHGAR